MMMRFMWCVIGFVVFSSSALVIEAEEKETIKKFPFQNGETILFFGDSITQNGTYVNYFEAYLLTRFPDKKFRVINHGISSETISGTTEEDHDPPRPWAHPRFTRDVTNWKPDWIISCFGMNDGNYYPFHEGKFKKYQEGNRRLLKRVEEEAHAKLIWATPTPFDPYRARRSNPDAIHYGYKFPAVDYDETLRRYSEWLLTQKTDTQHVIDLHSPLNRHLKIRRKEKVSFHLAPDAVHPNATGHWLMAQTILVGLGAPAKADACRITVSEENQKNDSITFVWKSKLPMGIDPAWDKKSLDVEKTEARLNQYQLVVTGLQKNERYELFANNAKLATFTAEELSKGVSLNSISQFPTVKAARELLSSVKKRRSLVYRNWRAEIAKKPVDKSLKQKLVLLNAKIESLRQPQSIALELKRIASDPAK